MKTSWAKEWSLGKGWYAGVNCDLEKWAIHFSASAARDSYDPSRPWWSFDFTLRVLCFEATVHKIGGP